MASVPMMKEMDEMAWRYFLRAHLHAGGIGSIAIGGSLVLALVAGGVITLALIVHDLFLRRHVIPRRNRW